MTEEQCARIPAYTGIIEGGSWDGQSITVVAWRPSLADLEAMSLGKPVYLTVLGSLPPHVMTTDFRHATSIA